MAFIVIVLSVCVLCMAWTLLVMWMQIDALKKHNKELRAEIKAENRNNLAIALRADCRADDARKWKSLADEREARIHSLEATLKKEKAKAIKNKCKEANANGRKETA